MKVFITDHVLTAGIVETEANVSSVSASMICWEAGGYSHCSHGEGRGWHRTKEGAVARAKEMQKKKIASLKKALKKIEDLRFL